MINLFSSLPAPTYLIVLDQQGSSKKASLPGKGSNIFLIKATVPGNASSSWLPLPCVLVGLGVLKTTLLSLSSSVSGVP